MAGRYLGPDETWPKHSRKLARAALREAADASWHLKKSDGHIFGTIRCPAVDQDAACRKPVYSTSGPADGSETAKKIREALRKCPHQPVDRTDDGDALGSMSDEEIQVRVERLLLAVDGLDRRAAAEAAMDDAAEQDDLPGFEEGDRRMTEGDNTAQAAWAQLHRPLEPWPPSEGRRELLDEAAQHVAAVSDAELKRRLTSKVDGLRP